MYFLAQNNQKTGPFTLEQLREMWRAGAVYPQTLYWEEGLADWQPLDRIVATVLLPGGPVPPPATPPVLPPGILPPSAVAVTAGEPSAYGLPASYLPAGPVFAPTPTASLAPADAAPGGVSHSLIAPTSLPPAAPGTLTAPPSTAPPEMPPAAYLSLVFAVLGPGLCLFGHGIGVIPGIALSVAAVVCGHTARAAIRGSGNRLPGEGVATAGLILGYGCLGLGMLFITLIVGLLVFGIGGTLLMSHH